MNATKELPGDGGEVFRQMNKPSAVIDKSLFHELCKHPDVKKRERMWHELHLKYQLVIPPSLIEETVVNAVAPGTKPVDEIERLIEQVVQHHPCWLDDVYEIAFRELVSRTPLNTLPALAEPVAAEIFQLRFDNEALRHFVDNRKQDARSIHDQWKAEQQRLATSAKRTELTSESEMFEVVRCEFLRALLDEERRKEMLERILGMTFRRRHRGEKDSIDRAFAEFTQQTFSNYYVTLACLLIRMAYVAAPIFTLPGQSPRMRLRFLKQELNNVYDAEYVTSALICDRFLTRDEKQARMCRVFELGGFWKGKVVYIPPDQDICMAIPSALI